MKTETRGNNSAICFDLNCVFSDIPSIILIQLQSFEDEHPKLEVVSYSVRIEGGIAATIWIRHKPKAK